MLCDKLDKADLPTFASLAGKNWVAETKYDGDRIRLVFKGGNLSLITRGKSGDVVTRYPELKDFSFDQDVVLDGEMCVLDSDGVSQFNEGIAFRTHCQTPDAIQRGVDLYPVTYVVFDILELGSEDLRSKPWVERRKILDSLKISHPHIIKSEYSYDILGLWQKMTARKEEGIILKMINAPYLENKRSSVWKKVKDIKEVDIVVSKYSVNPKGLRLETEDGIACQCAGFQSEPVRRQMDSTGQAVITINYLGVTKEGKYRQPTFKKLVEGAI